MLSPGCNMNTPKKTEPFVPRIPRAIDVEDLRSLTFWSKRFRIRPEQLRRAVKQVGSQADVVAQYLGQSRPRHDGARLQHQGDERQAKTSQGRQVRGIDRGQKAGRQA